jgi:hypothetical protein
VGEHGPGGPVVPGAPATHLVLGDSYEAIGGPEVLLDALPLPRDAHQFPQRCRCRSVTQVVGELARPCHAGVVALHPDRRGALLQIPGLVQYEHRTRVREAIEQVARHRPGPRQRPTQPGPADASARAAGMPGVLSGRPAVLALHWRHQTCDQVSRTGATHVGRSSAATADGSSAAQASKDDAVTVLPPDHLNTPY